MAPRYSATLFVAVPMKPATSVRTTPVTASRTTAPNAAGPGLPRDPPSASTMSDRVMTELQAGFGGADKDATALIAPDDLIRRRAAHLLDLARRELQPAAAAASAVQVRGSEPRLISADALVEAEQVLGNPGGDRRTLPRHDRALIIEIGEQRGDCIGLFGSFRCEAVSLCVELPDGSEGSLDPLHDLEFDVLELGLAARE